ncbi:keywimysin-related RiPP (plasmid) [Streptomyces sp. NBC_00190]|nr:keywimysin-related RiPP [Streptomyces sp. NBC_00190]WSZ45738.1 keywimysin-related RiPP [Streptomyces sp. NBC_00868]
MMKKAYTAPVFAAAGSFRADTGMGLPVGSWDWNHRGGWF